MVKTNIRSLPLHDYAQRDDFLAVVEHFLAYVRSRMAGATLYLFICAFWGFILFATVAFGSR